MFLIVTIALLLSYIQPVDGSELLEQSKEQADYYIGQINSGVEQDAYLWALSELYKSHPKIKNYISEQIESTKGTKNVLLPFISEKSSSSNLLKDVVFISGSPDLLIQLLLQQTEREAQLKLINEFRNKFGIPASRGVAYEDMLSHILEGEKITPSILPNDEFLLPHLFLFMDSSSYRLFDKKYFENLIEKWKNKIDQNSHDSIKYALMQIAYLRSLYILDEYQNIKQLFDFLINDNLIPNFEMKIKVFRYLGYSLYRLGYYDLGLVAARDYALSLSRYLNDKKNEIGVLAEQAAYLDHIGKIKEAQKVNIEILEKSEEYNIDIRKSKIFTNLSLTYKKSGEFDKHLNLQLEALEEAKEQGLYDHQLRILLILHLYFLESKDQETALLYLNKAKELAEKEGNSEHIARVNGNLGMLYRDVNKDYEKALDYFDKAQALFDHNSDFEYYIGLLDEKAKLYKDVKKYALSRATYKRIIELSESRDKIPTIESYLHLTELDLIENNLNNAKILLDKIETFDLSQLDFESIIKAKTIRADYLALTGKYQMALEILKPTINRLVERAKNSSNPQSGFWKVAPQYLDAFQLNADLLIETGQYKLAIETLDKLKTINDASLYQNQMVKSSLLDESELSQYKNLTAQLDVLRKKQLLAGEKELLGIQNKINRLVAQKNMLDRKISAMVDQRSMSVEEVQRLLGGRELVLHVTELKDQYYIARITRSEIEFNKIALDSTIRKKFNSAIENLSVGKTDMNQLSEISKILKLDNVPNWINTLTIIPDSYLYQLPVDVLPIHSDGFGYSYGDATYVVEKYRTHYLTSLNDFAPQQENKKSKKYSWDFAGYGISNFQSYENRKELVPLPYAESEVTNIVGQLTNFANKAAYLDSSSTERTFKQTASQSRILHLATHSELSERDPLFSTLYMSGDQSEEQDDEFTGQIFAYELFELNLANDLIMLNSCESGSGSYLQGTGVMGISRALRYAGAESLILNLWSVNDMMASDFAIEFYKHINQGKAKDEALRQAKLHFLKNKNANPHYWGPYILIGNRDALVSPNKETNMYFAASFMLFFITIASISLIKEWKQKAA